MFAWSPRGLPDQAPYFRSLKPSDVLFDDEMDPILFTSKADAFPVLCYKIDQEEDVSQYIVVPTSDAIVSRLTDGATALRSAMAQAWVWVVEAGKDYDVKRSWNMAFDAIPDELLPRFGYGIYPSHGVISERATPVDNPFLSFHFRVTNAEKGLLSFGLFKGLVDEVGRTIWSIFAPAVHDAAKTTVSEQTVRRAMRIPTYEPAFASLFIAIEQPIIDFSPFREQPEIDIARAQRNIARAYNTFFKSAEAVAGAATKGQLTSDLASDHIDAIEAVAPLIPTARSLFDRVEIARRAFKNDKRERSRLVIDVQTGQQIRDAYTLSLQMKRTLTGRVVETNAASHTFIIRSASYRQTTCVAWGENVKGATALIRNGMTVSVTGSFERRKRRDRLWIDRLVVEGKNTYAD